MSACIHHRQLAFTIVFKDTTEIPIFTIPENQMRQVAELMKAIRTVENPALDDQYVRNLEIFLKARDLVETREIRYPVMLNL